jgi:hypothetical protein
MIRKLLLPALAAAVLGGCVTGYDYRGGSGDYYYGQPSVDYDYYGGYYGGYGYPGWHGALGFGYGYGGYPYYGYGGYPYYGYPYYPPVIIVRPDPPEPGRGGPHRPDERRPGLSRDAVTSSINGTGHYRVPDTVAPMLGDRQPNPPRRFDPIPSREPVRLPAIPHGLPDSPRMERDDGPRPHH